MYDKSAKASLGIDDYEKETRYTDASQHVREIRDYKRGMFREVLGAVTFVSLALCGVRSVNLIK